MSDVVGLYRRFGVRLPALGDGWASTRCFSGGHRDRHPSARVHLRSGGFRCFTCGAKGGVLDALQLLGVYDRDEARRLATDYGILDPPRRPKHPRPSLAPPTTAVEKQEDLGDRIDWDQIQDGPAVVHDRTWIYVNEHGVPVGRVRRLDLADGQKRIWQERPDGDTWAAGLAGGHLPLYRLPEVLECAAAGRRILVVEGEKAVDALDRLGFFATTNAGGAGKWRDEHTAALTGATVLAICDCDPPGRLHAYQVTSQLLTANVQALIPFDPAELRFDGFDIVDHLAGVAETIRAVTPGLDDAVIRASLHDHLHRLLNLPLPATVQALQRWHEYSVHLTNPAGNAYLECKQCGEDRVHRVSHGIAYCRCGAHQAAPA